MDASKDHHEGSLLMLQGCSLHPLAAVVAWPARAARSWSLVPIVSTIATDKLSCRHAIFPGSPGICDRSTSATLNRLH